MKKIVNSKLKIFFLSLILALIITGTARAQENVDIDTSDDVPNPLNSPSSTISPAIRERIRAEMENRVQNLKNTQNPKNQLTERMATSSQMLPPDTDNTIRPFQKGSATSSRMVVPVQVKNRIGDKIGPKDRLMASSSVTIRQAYLNNGKSMAFKALEERKITLHKQFETAHKNLTDLRKRISARIEKERLNGKDLSSVRSLLDTADKKLLLALQAIKEFQNYKPVKNQGSDTTIASSTAIVDLDQIRSLNEKVRNSIKDAHRALTDVVIALAKISGSNPRNNNATSTTSKPSNIPTNQITPVESTSPATSIVQ